MAPDLSIRGLSSLLSSTTMTDSTATYAAEMRKHFLLDAKWKNLNHGSFGTFPLAVRDRMHEIQDANEHRPDPFLRFEYPAASDAARAAVAALLHAPVDDIVYVPNATTGVNTVLRNLQWNDDCRDEILYFSTIYAACAKTVEYVCESTYGRVAPHRVELEYPIEDDDLVARFRAAVHQRRAAGKTPRVLIFDTISSLPGVRMPFEALVAACRELDVLSLVDGAHGVGSIPIDLGKLDPDFFVSNCHKWLFVPRPCAVFFVPQRNQHLMRSSLPTSHGFVPMSDDAITFNPLPPPQKSEFVNNFEFVATFSVAPYLAVPAALKWREEVAGGEDKIMAYNIDLARRGGALVAEMLGTEVLDNASRSMSNCSMTNIRLPVSVTASPQAGVSIAPAQYSDFKCAMENAFMKEFDTFIPIYQLQGHLWARLSAQIYLDMEDFRFAGTIIKSVVEKTLKALDFRS